MQERINKQIAIFKKGVQYSNLNRSAKLGDGILALDIEAIEKYQGIFESISNQKDVTRFIPASGAATRMFQHLFNWNDEDEKCIAFKNNFEKLAFASEIKENDWQKTLERVLFEYATLPKGLVPFHKYGDVLRNAFQEHLLESLAYSEKGNIHFTINNNFKESIAESISLVNENKIAVTFSEQLKSTDTIAVLKDNTPYTDQKDNYFWRPAGHGALIENLNDIDADVIFIKNIDNIVTTDFQQESIVWSKVLSGILLSLKEDIDKHIRSLKLDCSPKELIAAQAFCKEHFKAENISSKEQLMNFLDRPLRVAGMIKNSGAAGGGPYWVEDKNGFVSLQIVEGAQMDMKNSEQANLVERSSHFNPVYVACAVRNADGNKYDLTKYVDDSACFISEKSVNGTAIKALELPGLWNGAMANWNSIFVEVPETVFTPVKTVNDLTNKMHQGA